MRLCVWRSGGRDTGITFSQPISPSRPQTRGNTPTVRTCLRDKPLLELHFHTRLFHYLLAESEHSTIYLQHNTTRFNFSTFWLFITNFVSRFFRSTVEGVFLISTISVISKSRHTETELPISMDASIGTYSCARNRHQLDRADEFPV